MEFGKRCAVCGLECDVRCSRCKCTYYCGDDHQREDWPTHKIRCQVLSRQWQNTQRDTQPTHPPTTHPPTIHPPTNHPPLNTVYIPGHVRNPSPAADVIKHSIETQPLMQLVWPYVIRLEAEVKGFIAQGDNVRCFISVEIVPASEWHAVQGFPYAVSEYKVVGASHASKYVEMTGSQKLQDYCSDHIIGQQLPCLFWCREPKATYTALIVPPWEQQEFITQQEL